MNVVPELSWMHFVVLAAGMVLLFHPWGWFSGSRRRREWEHAERLKAMELGLPVVVGESLWPRALVCIAIGAFVPVGVFVCAWLVSSRAPANAGIQGTVWGVSFLVSTVAVGCGTALAFALLGSRDRTERAGLAGKPPSFDPESFELTDHHS